MIQLEPLQFDKFINQASFASNGDLCEREWAHLILPMFPNCEAFWRAFVLPLTRRMDGYPVQPTQDISFRPSMDPRLEDLAIANYSLFVNLAYAHLYLQAAAPSFLEDVYVHLASACDLAELILERWYLLRLECTGKRSPLLQERTRDEFLALAGEYYDAKYHTLHEHYFSKGKAYPIRIIDRAGILTEYLGRESEPRRTYATLSGTIREFRNVIVHDTKIARIVTRGPSPLVPSPRLIHKYKDWRAVQSASLDSEVIRSDFVEPSQQSRQDTASLEEALNRLWDTLLADFKSLFCDHGSTLQRMFAIQFLPADVAPVILVPLVPEEPQPPIPPSGTFAASALFDGTTLSLGTREPPNPPEDSPRPIRKQRRGGDRH
jgi:hypothetical protein